MADTNAPEEPERPEQDALPAPPAPVMETGRIQIIVGMDENGKMQRSWAIQGMTGYEALGHLEVAANLIKMMETQSWAQGMQDNAGG
jgi:hypothetical protein